VAAAVNRLEISTTIPIRFSIIKRCVETAEGGERQMALIRWEPARELTTLQSEMNRLFNSFFEGNGEGSPRRWTPSMDLVEVEDHLVLRADLPGLSEEDVNIEVQDNVLTVSGERTTEREEKREGYYRMERAFGNFSRSMTLPEGVDAEKIQASFDKGVLEVRIPKPEERKPRRISIGVGGKQDVEGSASENK
jgi:HSP20 family protein